LLKTGLRMCDEQGFGVYLETAKPANLPFDSAHVLYVQTVSGLRNGPRVCSMWRPPRKL
jgi:hypothetical protein